jgi:hypothetical protein
MGQIGPKVRITIRCDPTELDGVDRFAAVLGESRSGAIRRMIRLVSQNLNLLSSLDASTSEQERRSTGLGDCGAQQAVAMAMLWPDHCAADSLSGSREQWRPAHLSICG